MLPERGVGKGTVRECLHAGHGCGDLPTIGGIEDHHDTFGRLLQTWLVFRGVEKNGFCECQLLFPRGGYGRMRRFHPFDPHHFSLQGRPICSERSGLFFCDHSQPTNHVGRAVNKMSLECSSAFPTPSRRLLSGHSRNRLGFKGWGCLHSSCRVPHKVRGTPSL